MIRTRVKLAVIDNLKANIATDIMYEAELLGYSQSQLAEKTGLHQSDVSEIFSGKYRRFTIDRLLMVLIELGHSPIISVC